MHSLREAIHALALDSDKDEVRTVLRSHRLNEHSSIDLPKFTRIIHDLVEMYRKQEEESAGGAQRPLPQRSQMQRSQMRLESQQMIDTRLLDIEPQNDLNGMRRSSDAMILGGDGGDRKETMDRFDAQMANMESDLANGELPNESTFRHRNREIEKIDPGLERCRERWSTVEPPQTRSWSATDEVRDLSDLVLVRNHKTTQCPHLPLQLRTLLTVVCAAMCVALWRHCGAGAQPRRVSPLRADGLDAPHGRQTADAGDAVLILTKPTSAVSESSMYRGAMVRMSPTVVSGGSVERLLPCTRVE